MTGEVEKTKYIKGFPIKFYEKIRDRNEALDLRVYWLACLDILKPNLLAIERHNLASTPPPEPMEYQLNPPPSPPTTEKQPSGNKRLRFRMKF